MARYIREIYQIKFVWLYVLLATLAWSNIFYQASLMATFFNKKQINIRIAHLFLISVCLLFFLKLLSILLKKKIIVNIYEEYLVYITNKKMNLKDNTASVFCRNLELYIDNLFIKLDFIVSALVLVLFFIYITYKYQYLSIFLYISILLLLPILYFQTKKNKLLYVRVQNITDKRLQIGGLITSRHKILSSLKLYKSPLLIRLSKFLTMENTLRNKDSFFQSLEVYFENFIKVSPIIAALYIYQLFGQGSESLNSEALWISLPVVGLIFTFPRSIASLDVLKRSQSVLRSFFSSYDLQKSDVVYVGENDSIWEGTLSDNIFSEGGAKNILSALNLTSEISSTKVIESNGANISQGQKVRILLARGLVLATKQKLPLRLNLNFNCLDKSNKENISKFLNSLGNAISIELSELAMASLSVREPSEKNSQTMSKFNVDSVDNYIVNKKSKYGKIKSLFGEAKQYVLLFVLAAAISSVIHALIYFNYQLHIILFLSFLLSISGLLLASFSGYFVEKKIRSDSKKLLLDNIKSSLIDNKIIKKIFNIEYQNVIEKYAIYSHDLIWVASLFFVATASALFNFNIYSAISILFLLVSYFLLFKILVPKLARLRLSHVNRSQKLINSMYDLALLTNISNINFNQKLKLGVLEKYLIPNVKSWFNSKYYLIQYKVILAVLSQFTVGITTAMLMYIFILSGVEYTVIAIVFGSFMALDYESSRLFSAFSGFIIHADAKSSLEQDVKIDSSPNLDIFAGIERGIRVANFNFFGVNAKPTVLQYGLTLLRGASGSGKSIYLNELYERSKTQDDIDIIHFTENSLKDISVLNRVSMPTTEDLYNLIERKKGDVEYIFIIDETLLSNALPDVLNFIRKSHQLAVELGFVVILVDHRVTSHSVSVNISDIIQ